jgi:hypothetical protein
MTLAGSSPAERTNLRFVMADYLFNNTITVFAYQLSSGDWHVKLPDGTEVIMTDDIFRDSCVLISEPNSF